MFSLKIAGFVSTAASLLANAPDLNNEHCGLTGTFQLSSTSETMISKEIESDVSHISFVYPGWFLEKMPIPGRDICIKFKREPSLVLQVSTRCVIIEEWGVRVALDVLTPKKFQNAIVRQYLYLADRARRQCLNSKEREYWYALVRDSNYSDFCQKTAPMLSIGGVRVRSYEGKVEVLWDGFEPELLCGNFAEQLAVVEDGEEFSARGRFINNRLSALSDVVPCGRPISVDLTDLLES